MIILCVFFDGVSNGEWAKRQSTFFSRLNDYIKLWCINVVEFRLLHGNEFSLFLPLSFSFTRHLFASYSVEKEEKKAPKANIKGIQCICMAAATS